MERRQIIFTEKRKAEYLSVELKEVGEDEALVETEFTVISGGTERACVMGMPNTSPLNFPKRLGYCGIGYVREIGSAVKDFAVGDRVLVYHGYHANCNVVKTSRLTKVTNDALSSLDAAFVIIASMGLGGVRRLEIEIGESAMVMGLGLLGLFSVQFCRLNGAYPVIAADPNPVRRDLALKLGADYALDPTEEGFVDRVKELTGGKGINACVEVTGISAAMKQALECASYMGRISLLGCTRVSDCSVDYYRMVHKPAVQLIGAHNVARPKVESYPHHWTHHDDCRAILDLLAAGRIQIGPIFSRLVKPENAPEIYLQLCDDPNFPIGTVFDWRDSQ